MVGWPTGWRTLPGQGVVVRHDGGHKVVGLAVSLGGEGAGVRVLLAEIGVVGHGVLLSPGPHIPDTYV